MKKLLQALFLSYILLLTGYSEVELKKLSRITLKNYFYSADFLQKSNSNNSTVDLMSFRTVFENTLSLIFYL